MLRKYIGDRAFYSCMGLERITIPKSVRIIGEDAFGTEEGKTFYCIDGSDAERYLKKNGYHYVVE